MIPSLRISDTLPAAVDAVLDRARFRERGIWPAFEHHGAGGEVANAWFRMFLRRGEGGWLELREYAGEELALLVADANRTLADVDADMAILAADIAVKRYLANVEDAMERAGLDTRRLRNAGDLEYVRAQLKAVEADRIGLETTRMETSLQLERISLECDRLRAGIREEGLHQAEADREVAETRLRKAEADLRLQQVRLDVVSAQRQLAETALDALGIDLEKAAAAARVAEVDGRMARLAGEPLRLQIEQTQTQAAQEGIAGDQERREALTAIERDAALIDKAFAEWRAVKEGDQLAARKANVWIGFYCGLLRQASELERLNQNYDLSAKLSEKAVWLQSALDNIDNEIKDEIKLTRYTYPLESMMAEAEKKAAAIGRMLDANVMGEGWKDAMGGGG